LSKWNLRIQFPSKKKWFEGYTGGTTGNGWSYEKEGVVKTFDVKTNGTWPFIDDEPGLYINCQYSWDGIFMKAKEGSGSKGEWDGISFRWHCFPMGGFYELYEYKWEESNKRFVPKESEEKIPTWIFENNCLKKEEGFGGADFADVTVEGSVPPPLVLAIAMHSWQWKREGELTELISENKEEDE